MLAGELIERRPLLPIQTDELARIRANRTRRRGLGRRRKLRAARHANEGRAHVPLCRFLAPVPFHQNVTSAAVNPVVFHPSGVRARRQFPSSWDPHIGIAIPTMVAGDPNMIPAGSHSTPLNDLMRWSNPNYNLGSRGAEGQPNSENESNQTLTEHSFPFLLLASQIGRPGTRVTYDR